MKKIYYVLIAILLLLVITNPGVKAFKDYLGYNSYGGLKRKYNFFVCSVYQKSNSTYFGIVGNFIKLSPKPPKLIDDSTKPDSAKMDTTPLPPPKGSIKVDTTADGLPIFRKKLSIDGLAKNIKKKYPVYNGIDNKTLVNKFIAKYPKYRDSVNF